MKIKSKCCGGNNSYLLWQQRKLLSYFGLKHAISVADIAWKGWNLTWISAAFSNTRKPMLTIAGREQTKVVFRGFVVGQTLSRHTMLWKAQKYFFNIYLVRTEPTLLVILIRLLVKLKFFSIVRNTASREWNSVQLITTDILFSTSWEWKVVEKYLFRKWGANNFWWKNN